jgi:hypothetical protein
MICESTDFMYPLLADVYFPIVTQDGYGSVNKQWTLDRTVACSLASVSRKARAEVTVDVEILLDGMLVGKVKKDLRIDSTGTENAITNVILTNVRDANGNILHLETAGPRKGKGTIFEVAKNEPIVGPFGSVEYWRILLRRSENQGVDV